MTVQTLAIAIDSNIATYLLQAMYGELDGTNLDEERKAAFRIFLWSDIPLGVTPAVKSEIEKIPTLRDRIRHERLEEIHLIDIGLDMVQAHVHVRASELRGFHTGEADCVALAEAELSNCGALLTLDDKLIRHLQLKSKVRIVKPSEYWLALAIPRGTPPRWSPAATNPLFSAPWWHW